MRVYSVVINISRYYFTLRLYSRAVQCEIRINRGLWVYDRDFSRPSPESKSRRRIHSNYRFESGSKSPFREIALLPPQSQNRPSADIAVRAKAALNDPVTDRRACRPSRDGSEQFGSGTQAYAAKFEPAAWSWAQMTSGSGAPKRILSGETFKFKLQRPN